MDKYFKKPNGLIIKVTPNHDISSLKKRFIEVDVKGKEIKKVVKKAKKKDKK